MEGFIKGVKMEDTSFALEMLKELKTQNRRQHILIIILIFVIVSMIIGFFIYESQFETVTDEMTIDQMQTNTNNSSMIGEIN
jgi:uncharacterized protein YabE (DUF348 family)